MEMYTVGLHEIYWSGLELPRVIRPHAHAMIPQTTDRKEKDGILVLYCIQYAGHMYMFLGALTYISKSNSLKLRFSGYLFTVPRGLFAMQVIPPKHIKLRFRLRTACQKKNSIAQSFQNLKKALRKSKRFENFTQAQIRENIKAPRHLALCGESAGDRWIPRTEGQ